MYWSSLLALLPLFLGISGSSAQQQFDSGDDAASNMTAHRDIVDLGYAKYLGNRTFHNTVSYLGIPYAEPPVGDLRFRATVPLDTGRVAKETHGKVVDARNYADFCVQGAISNTDRGGAGSEDCLNVDIYTPANATSHSKLPVLVYIHGGGYVFGNPASWPFAHWIHQSPNVVIVSVYYRLDALGFLAHPAFANKSKRLGDLNTGFQDQIEALKWVQKHIGAFGGDKDRVTINGESAGGASIELHLIANESKKPLFHGAIAQSVYRTPVPLPEQQVPLFDKFVEVAGCSGGSLKKQMDCLRKADLSAIAPAQDFASNNASLAYHYFHPVLDGTILRDYPTRLITEGKFAHVPLIVGFTSNETLSGGTLESALKSYFPALTQDDLNTFVDLYENQPISSGGDVFRTGTGEPELRCAASIMGTAYAKKTKAWTYRYNQPNPTGGDPAVEHAAENWMMFLGSNTGGNGTFALSPMTPTETNFASELIAYWLSFVRSGDPNKFKLDQSPQWSRYSENRNRIVLQQGTESTSGTIMEIEPADETKRCGFVADIAEHEQA